ncbi:hypothetical protein HDU93_006908, partial [Gonapodya sp. JEL0774]
SHVRGAHELKKYGTDWRPNMPRDIPCGHMGCDKVFAMEEAAWQHRINKHTSVDNTELEGVPDTRAAPPTDIPSGTLPDSGQSENSTVEYSTATAGDQDGEFAYYPCPTCGQAVVRRSWGMLLHLEQLKPVLGLDMRCPAVGCGRTFIEGRALVQHYKFCRLGAEKRTLLAV